MKKYTKEFLIEEFWRFYKENNRYPTGKDMKAKNNYPSQDAYMTHWGTYGNFLKELGIMGENEWYKCDEQVLINMYENYSQEEIIDKLIVKRGWGRIKTKARQLGLNRNKDFIYADKRMSDEFLINELQRFYNIYDKIPSCTDFDNNTNFPSHKVYQKHFGSWNNAIELAGFRRREKNISKEDIMNEVIKFFNENGRSPYYNEIIYCNNVYHKYWDTWNELLLECGLLITQETRKPLNKQEGIILLQKLYKELGRIPTSTDINVLTNYNKDWVYNTFNGFENALFEAGIISIENKIPSDTKEYLDKCINGLINLYDILGRVPTVEEYDDYARENRLLNRKALEFHLNIKWSDICLKYFNMANVGSIGVACLDNLNRICRSTKEQIISNWLINNNIFNDKEWQYNKVLNNIKDKRRFDWYVLDDRNNKFYVEYFGLWKNNRILNYTKKAKKKIKDLCKAGLIDNCIFIFPNDLKIKSFDEIFNKVLIS